MNDFFKFFEDNFSGIVIFLLAAFIFIFFLDWIARIFAIGKYKNLPKDAGAGGLVFVFSQLLVKIITDFRHFLALLLVLIFASALGYAISVAKGDVEDLIKVLQAVVATLGGLVGSIVGYYFGESAARNVKSQNQVQTVEDANPTVQNTSSMTDDIKPVVIPGGENKKTGGSTDGN